MSGDVPQLNYFIDNLVNRRQPTAHPAGVKDGDKGHIRYALRATDYPNLTIINPIYDNDRNVIMPGYYGLILSDDRNFLVLVQNDKHIATIPVFKYEEDESQFQEQPRDKKSLFLQQREAKKKEKQRQKAIKKGEITPDDEIYNNASIKYDDAEGYYLIEYERGPIRAWGAIKK